MTFGDFCASENVSTKERQHLSEVLTALRRDDAYYGGGGGAITFRNMHIAIRAAAFRAERRALRTFDEKDLHEMLGLDAAGNLVLAVWMHLDDVRPILRQHMKARPVNVSG